jgi:hypothetical protein
MSEVQEKYFTPSEAKKTLPLVKNIVRDILHDVFEVRTISDSLGGEIEDNGEIKRLLANIDGYMKELEEIGCSYKDWNFSIGLVDFPSIIDGEEVLLCWRSDEEDILFYHGLNEGYAGRKPIPEDYL